MSTLNELIMTIADNQKEIQIQFWKKNRKRSRERERNREREGLDRVGILT